MKDAEKYQKIIQLFFKKKEKKKCVRTNRLIDDAFVDHLNDLGASHNEFISVTF